MIILIIVLQYRLWFGESNVVDANNIKDLIAEQKAENVKLDTRNRQLYAQISNLSNENASEEIEGRARNNLGMIKEGETFFLLVNEK